MVNQLRVFHADNAVQLKKVDEFDEYYDCKEIVVKFTKTILFDIEVDLKKHSALIFADISFISQCEREEKYVLFDLVTIFRIEKTNSIVKFYFNVSNEYDQFHDESWKLPYDVAVVNELEIHYVYI